MVTPWGNKGVAWRKRWCKEQCQVHASEQDHARRGWTTSRRRQDSQWKSQSEWQRTGINGESTSMVWPTLGSRTAEEQNRWLTSLAGCLPRNLRSAPAPTVLQDHGTVTVIPPTQEVAVLGSRKNTVRVGNITQSQLALLYSKFHKVIQHLIVSRTYTVNVRHQQTLTLSGSLSLSLSD